MNTMILQNRQNELGKLVTVKFVGGNRPHETFMVMPGTKPQDLLRQMNLGVDFQLSKGTPDTVFGIEESIYGQLQDGDLLFVSSRVDAGSW